MTAKRIAISTNTVWNITNFRTGLVNSLRAKGHEVVVMAPRDRHVETIESYGCRFVELPMDNKGTNPLKDMKLLKSYHRILSRERPDVFLGFTIKPNIYGSLAAQMLGIPVINNISGLGTAFINQNWLTRLVRFMYRTALKRSACVFFQNKDDQALFCRNNIVEQHKTRLLPGSGIDLSYFKAPPRAQGKRETETEFLLVARLLYDKGVHEFVEAARLLKAKKHSAKCSLLGFLDADNRTAVSRNTLQQWVDEGAIHYHGAVDDIRPFVARADCVVLPSYREGLPRSLLEGAAMSRPLIATNVAGCRDVVEDGVNGFLCNVKDATDLARAMERFLKLTYRERSVMGDAARSKIKEEFDEKIVIERYHSEIRKALS